MSRKPLPPPSEFIMRPVNVPDSPLLGTVVRVEWMSWNYSQEAAEREVQSGFGSRVRLTFADGRKVLIDPEGPEVEGLGITEEV